MLTTGFGHRLTVGTIILLTTSIGLPNRNRLTIRTLTSILPTTTIAPTSAILPRTITIITRLFISPIGATIMVSSTPTVLSLPAQRLSITAHALPMPDNCPARATSLPPALSLRAVNHHLLPPAQEQVQLLPAQEQVLHQLIQTQEQARAQLLLREQVQARRQTQVQQQAHAQVPIAI